MSSTLSKPIPLSILITITCVATVTITVEAAKSGALNFFGVGSIDNQPIINGTIINNDNKTFGILIVPTSNITIPDPPVVNDTIPPVVIPPVNDTKPPIVNDTKPVPTPKPVGKIINVIMVGDIFGDKGRVIAQEIKEKDPEFVVILGDLGYGNDADYLKEVYGPFGNVVACIIGNHDDNIAELVQYCKNDWYVIKNTVLFIGLNTDGNLGTQQSKAVKLLQNKNFMENITSVHVMTHKPCATPSGSDHSVESKVKVICDAIKAAIPQGVKAFFDNGHNHNLVRGIATDGTVYHTSGGGGRQLYDCGTVSGIWKSCVEKFGFLEYVIQPDGKTTYAFHDEKGIVIR